MSADADDPLARQLRALRREYVADSSQRVTELRSILDRLSRGDRSALAEFRQAFHRLAGSGGSYGFPVVSTQSREGERMAQRLIAANAAIGPDDFRAFGTCVDAVASAFADAQRALDTEPAG